MNKNSFRKFGVFALGLYALSNLSFLLSPLGGSARNLGALFFVVCVTAALVAAEIWAVMYWRLSKSKLSILALVFTSIIVLANLLTLMPEFRFILSRLLGQTV